MRKSSLRVVLAGTLSFAACLPRFAAAAPHPGELFRSAFEADYTVRVEQPAAPAGAPPTGLLQSDFFAFTSRRGTTGPDGKTYLRFSLRILEYGGETAAADALRRLAGELTGDLFVKWPLLAFTAGPALYRLDGSCLYSPETWREIEERLLGIVASQPGKEPATRLRIACGGAVLESPPPAGKP